MKPLLLFLLALSFLPGAGFADETLPRLKTEGNQFTADGEPVRLRGVSLCNLEWHKPLEQIEQLTNSPDKWAANIIRLPVQKEVWDKTDPQSYIRAYLDPAVKACKKHNIYCIIDWHQIGPWKDAKDTEALENFWKIVAPRYAPDKNILYEIFNEPTEPVAKTKENWLAWRDKAQPWVDSIRKVAPNTVLLIGSPLWSQLPAMAVEDPFRGDNLAYVMHLYPNYAQNTWDAAFGDASKTVPIFMSEWGWSSQDQSKGNVIHGNIEDYATPLKAYLDERPQIAWTAWSYDPLCGPAMLGVDKEMGGFVKDWLSETPKQPASK